MNSIQTKTLGEICDDIGGEIRTGPFGSQLHESDYREEGVPVVMPQELIDGRVRTDGIARISEEDAERLAQHRLWPGDIVYGRRGDIGRRALVGKREAGWLCGTGCIRIRLGESVVRSKFLFYYLGQPNVIAWITNQAIGATMPNLNTGIIRRIAVEYPDLRAQQKVEAILSAYDDLIENNRRRIGILEEMVRAIYREWFVEFRAPGVRFRKATAAEKQATGKDRFPNGWTVSSLDEECVSIEDGDWIETKDQGGSDFRLLQVSNIGVGEFIETGKFRHVTRATFERLHCREVVPGMILVARMPDPVGRAWLVTRMPWRMITAVDVAIVQPDAAKLGSQYCVNLLNSPESLERANVRTTGTTRARLTRRDLGAMPLVVPAMGSQEAFESIAAANYELSNALRRKNENLRSTRDLLLPRLMSGEVSVEDLEFATADEQVREPAEMSK